MSKQKSAVAEPDQSVATMAAPAQKRKPRRKERPKRQPRYHVILWDDDDHSYDYVMRMMQDLFAASTERSFEIAREVDTVGRAICLTTTLEHAELKRDQIHSYGKDALIARCQGSMSASIEAES